MLPPNQTPAPELIESVELLGLTCVRHGLHAPLPVLATAYKFTHILYTSGNSFLTWDLWSIWAAYKVEGRRCLFSTDRDLDLPDYQRMQFPTHRRVYRHLNCDSFMGEIRYLYDRLERFERGEIWRQDFKDGTELDKYCEVFQNMGSDGNKDIEWNSRDGYFVNNYTNSTPCVLTFNGTSGITRLFKRWKRQWRKQQIRKALALGWELNV